MKRYFVWALALFNSLIGFSRFIRSVIGPVGDNFSFTEIVGIMIITVAFSVLGAIIILRAQGNRVGWLMVLLGFVLADPFATYLAFNETTLQTQRSFLFYLAFWTQGWFYFVIIYAVFLIILHFPDGRPPSPRWNIINLISLTTLGQYILVYTFQPKFGDATLFVDNPIAMLPVSAEETLSVVIFGLGLILLGLCSVTSIFVRFRKAGSVVRSQIKWVLFSGVIFLVAIGYRLGTYEPDVSDWTEYLLTIALLSMAVSISTAILRYRLYDIDIIIRRTLQYTLLSVLLALVYFSSVVLLQNIVGRAADERSPLVIVVSTLLIAALFAPLRQRVQEFIDRRFFRKKYDAQQILAQFAKTARDEVEMEVLTAELNRVIQETMQPETLAVWLKEQR